MFGFFKKKDKQRQEALDMSLIFLTEAIEFDEKRYAANQVALAILAGLNKLDEDGIRPIHIIKRLS
jgi:hypothetical protein